MAYFCQAQVLAICLLDFRLTTMLNLQESRRVKGRDASRRKSKISHAEQLSCGVRALFVKQDFAFNGCKKTAHEKGS
jgi:hypothetical protein